MESHVKEELRKFGETVSVKGISRILKARNTVLRIIWLLAVLTCFGILLWQVTTVLINYFKWPVDSIYKESTGRPTFPDITICKLFSMDSELDSGMQWSQYVNLTNQKKQQCTFDKFRNITNLTREADYNLVWSMLQNPSGYFNSFPPDNESLPSIDESFIIDYNYFAWEWDVSESGYIVRTVFDNDYGKCTTFQTNDSSYRTQIKGFTAILYIDDFPSTMSNNFFPTPAESHANGVRVIVHAPDTRPQPKDGHSVGPGTETTMRLLHTIRKRMLSPYGNCTERTYVDQKDKTSPMYTASDCYDVCLQQYYIQACNCLNSNFYYTKWQSQLVNQKICGSSPGGLDPNNLDDVRQLACMLETKTDMEFCSIDCQPPCKEHRYDVAAFSVPWPHVSVQMAFYQKYIKDKGYGDLFDVYANLSKSTMNTSDLLRALKNIHVIEDNFIQLNVIFDQYSPMTLTETASMTTDKMLSLIGGALSLWLGITVMTIVEFVQLIFDLMEAIQRRKKTATNQKPGSERGLCAKQVVVSC